MHVQARHWEIKDGGRVRCLLCPHFCTISEGKSGKCLIRANIDGKLIQTAYGEVCSASVDPIEKKPLYHFHPGSKILSVGTNGCNMTCRHCQNWQISTQQTHRTSVTPEQLLETSLSNNSIGIAYTYNEPLVWFEFVYDCAVFFRKNGQKNVLVSNGQINPEPLKELLPLIDAANIDLKGFTDEFYKNEGGHLKTTLNTIEKMAEKGVHLELTNLVIPMLNDSSADFENMCRFISGISRDIPLHLSRYFPQHKSTLPPTLTEKLVELRNISMQYLNFVYIGNVTVKDTIDTLCPKCRTKLIERSGYTVRCLVEDDLCPVCSEPLPFCL